MAAYDDWWSSPEDVPNWYNFVPRPVAPGFLQPPFGALPPQDQLLRASGGPTPTMPNWGQLQDPGIFAAPRRQPAGDVVLPRSEPSPFGDAMPNMATGAAPAQDDSTFRLATAALAPWATGNARMGGASSVEGVGPELSNAFLKMAQDMPEHLRGRLAIESGYRDRDRQMQVNPSAPNSRHGAGTGPPGTGMALDLAKDPEVLAWIRENGPQYGVGFPLYPKDPREINHLEMVAQNGARLPAGSSTGSSSPPQGQPRMGIFDAFAGQGGVTPGLLDQVGYMDPTEYDRAKRSQSMMGLWAGLLQGGGPSLEPRNFGSALGAGLLGQQKFGAEFDEASQHRATAQAKLAEVEAKRLGYKVTQDWINKGGQPGVVTPADAAAGSGGSGSAPPGGGGGGGGSGADPRGMEPYIRAEAARLNIDPDIAVRVAQSEGLGTFSGDGGKSGGAFQLYTGGGVGNLFQRDTGLDPLDPKNEQATITYALQHAAKNGWGDWNGAKKLGITGYTGIGERGAAPAATTTLSSVPDFAGMFAGNQGPSYAPAAPGQPPAAAPRAPAPSGVTPPVAPPGAGAALTQQQQNAAALAATGRPLFPPGTQFNSRGEAISGDLAAALPGQQSGAALPPAMLSGFRQGTTGFGAPQGSAGPVQFPPARETQASGGGVPPMAAGDAGGGADDSPYGSGVFSPGGRYAGGAPPVPSVMAAPAVPPPPAAAPTGGAPVTMPAAPPTGAPGAAPAPGGMTVTLPAPPALPQLPPTQMPVPLPPAPEQPGVPARPVIPRTAGAAPAVSPDVAQRARQAQGVVLGLTMMGVHVPDFLQKEAGIEVAGRTAAAEAEARQPIELQNKAFEASLTAAQKRWDALSAEQQATLAHERGMTRDQMNAVYANIHEEYKTSLRASTEPQIQRSIAEQTLPTEITKIEKKEQAQADNAQTTMVIGGREVPMTVGQANRITNGEPPDKVLGRGVLELGKQYLTPEEQSRAQAGATKSVDYSFKRLEDAATAGDAAGRNLQTMGQLAKAAERFKTGATAEVWLDVKRYARDAGLITGADVPDGELIRQGTTKLAVMNAPRQGAISNFERGLMATINPQLVTSPEAFSELVAISARLDQYDMQVSQIHHDVAQNNRGVPDYLEANRRIRALGPPISPQERAALERIQTNDAARAAAPPAATTAAPYRWDPAANGGQGAVVPNTGR